MAFTGCSTCPLFVPKTHTWSAIGKVFANAAIKLLGDYMVLGMRLGFSSIGLGSGAAAVTTQVVKLIPTFDLDAGDQYLAEDVAFGAVIVGGLLTGGASEAAVAETAIEAAGTDAVLAGADVLPAAEAEATASGAAEAGAAADKTYRIVDGVRRAKAAEIAVAKGVGNGTLPAEVLGQPGKIIQVPVSALRSPKAVIEANTPPTLARWLYQNLYPTLRGSEPPPILVTPGSTGIPIPQVIISF
jgi:hypothetical protein